MGFRISQILVLALGLISRVFNLQADATCIECAFPGKLATALNNTPIGSTLCVTCERVALVTEEIPVSLAAFTALTHLSLAQNNIQSLGLDVLGLLAPIAPGMKIFNLSKNEIVGTVPEGLPQLFDDLEALDLSDAGKISGTIPNSISQMGSLSLLLFGTNKFTGTLPEGIDALQRLRVLELNDNRLTGTVPQGISRLTELTRLRIAGNDFVGTLPPHFATDTDLPGGHVFSKLPREFDLATILMCVGGALIGIFMLVLVVRYRLMEHRMRRARHPIPVATSFGQGSWMDDQPVGYMAKPVYAPPTAFQGFAPPLGSGNGSNYGTGYSGGVQGHGSHYAQGYSKHSGSRGGSHYESSPPPLYPPRSLPQPPIPPPSVHRTQKPGGGVRPPPGLGGTLKRARNKAKMLKNQSAAWFSTKYPGPDNR